MEQDADKTSTRLTLQLIFSLKQFLLVIALMLSALAALGRAQVDGKVNKASVTTPDALVFEISVDRTSFIRGSAITVNYSITNLGNRNVFQIVKAVPEIVVNDLWILDILKPVGLPDEHKAFDFHFVPVPSKRSVKGKFVIESKVYQSNDNYEFRNAAIRVGFAYLFDLSSFKGCQKPERRYECLKTLSELSQNLRVGDLVVDIVNSAKISSF